MKPTTVVEVIVTYISAGWAYVLLTTPGLFERSKNFSGIESVAQYEWVVGIVALVCAITKIIGMALHKRRIRWLGLIMSTLFWVVISAGFLVASDAIEFNTGFIVYSGIAVMCLWTSKEVMQGDGAE